MTKERNPNMGILHYDTGKTKFSLTRYLPSDYLRFFVQHYWLVDWDLRGQAPYAQEVLQHPGVNVVFERGHSRICGIESKKSAHVLEEKGQIVGVLFRPGAFHCYFQEPMSALTDRIAPISDCFAIDSSAFEQQLFALEDREQRIGLVESLLRQNMPERDETVELLNNVIDKIIHDRSMTKVEQLVDRFGVPKRTLQRLFHEYVGVSPKWVIQRYRMHEAGELLENGMDMAQLALELGYSDQAHFSKDFKAAVGKSPMQYVRNNNI
ncbi:helix-turn-helix domain-containing protein [Paenibacillus allorhizosphaerae]|uniref:HTH-type transcriptional activator RhaS n=1 Tax=Paenibacillus allorhizosphaerae TaxID=2849866 RepID=A0ABN7TW23_9BACL|nr:helix-turn-helix domain-containing protein [Paenibacillus allorhizosphaerae]CAG7654698.1 HTH-type transcriptional activator RhaS [Paenibacillus allorhizosphaerae]